MGKGFRLARGILFFMVMIFLVASFSQQEFLYLTETKLAGVAEPKSDTLFWKSWGNRDYQFSMEESLNFNAGFRNSLVRLHNQIDYSLFHIASNAGITLGIDHVLFADNYIEAYTGEDYIGEQAIHEKIEKLVRINSFLTSKGIGLILVFAPSKARFYPEYIPTHQLRRFTGISNYDEYTRQLQDVPEIIVIDFNSSFIQMKDTVSYPLFPKKGIHWTNYVCQTIIPDTLIRIICRQKELPLPDYTSVGINYPDTLLNPDYDLYELLNLFQIQSGERIPYPVFPEDRDTAKLPLRVLTIGDSFFWNLYGHYPWRYIFQENDFWFYSKTRYPKHKYKDIQESDINLIQQDFLNHDVVIVMITEINLSGFLQFPENAIRWLDLENDHDLLSEEDRHQKIQLYIEQIRNDVTWLKKVKKKAAIKGISLDEMIRRDAEYMVDTN